MRDLSDIRHPVERELQWFETSFQALMASGAVFQDTIGHAAFAAGGKRLRPLLVYLCAKLFGDVNESTHRAAMFVETLHTATLIHDDIVDGSEERRGHPALHVALDTPTAVLTGDFLLAKAMLLLSNDGDLLLLQELLTTILAMSEGELMQRKEVRSKKTEVRSQEGYVEVIKRKTAMLFRSCCVVGAMSTQVSSEELPLMADFGLNLGLVFQMRDDLLDRDDLESVAFAEALLPQYLEKAQRVLNCLDAVVENHELIETLRALLDYCAFRRIP